MSCGPKQGLRPEISNHEVKDGTSAYAPVRWLFRSRVEHGAQRIAVVLSASAAS